MAKLILIRHGQSQWNLENKFTGWTDVPLTPLGEDEALRAGRALIKEGIVFDAAFTSLLSRAIKTLHILQEACSSSWIKEERSWRLNERHYGALQGLNKEETAEKYGAQQVKIWRRSYEVCPPALNKEDERNPRFDIKYKNIDPRALPLGESLKDTIFRVIPYWQDRIAPVLLSGKNALVVAHGNSLRGLIKYLEGILDDAIANLEIPTGEPIIYNLDKYLNVVKSYKLQI
ncbi:MAG: 2,3-diphosphoglycerate-dependent phosphoglycerate mutase [Opitutales bacterium]|nr:2,3-diphosphoglycerate-dependent phosphoglycerate mutase [Opitutales bacterium]